MKRKRIGFILCTCLLIFFLMSGIREEAALHVTIVSKQNQIDRGVEVEMEFHIENVGQVPISNIVVYSKSQNYVTRIAMLQPGECNVFTKGESKRLSVVKKEEGSFCVTLCAQGVAAIKGTQRKVEDEAVKKITVNSKGWNACIKNIFCYN